MGKYDKTWYTYMIYKTMGKYKTKYDTLKLHKKTCYTITKRRITVHKGPGYRPQWKKPRHGAEVIRFGPCLTILHPAVLYVHTEWISQHDRKESVYIVEKMMKNGAIKEGPRTRQKADEVNNYIENRDAVNTTEGF